MSRGPEDRLFIILNTGVTENRGNRRQKKPEQGIAITQVRLSKVQQALNDAVGRVPKR